MALLRKKSLQTISLFHHFDRFPPEIDFNWLPHSLRSWEILNDAGDKKSTDSCHKIPDDLLDDDRWRDSCAPVVQDLHTDVYDLIVGSCKKSCSNTNLQCQSRSDFLIVDLGGCTAYRKRPELFIYPCTMINIRAAVVSKICSKNLLFLISTWLERILQKLSSEKIIRQPWTHHFLTTCQKRLRLPFV